MSSFQTPRVVVSRCLGFDHCRYNGAMISDEFVEKLCARVECITVCPEVEIGLGVPRDPIRIVAHDDVSRLVQPSTGKDVTGDMETFASDWMNSLGEVDGFLLKSRSPSCGFKDVKLFNDRGNIIGKGAGMFARAVMARFPDTVVEDEGRLSNFAIREHFLIRIFTSARFRNVRTEKTMRELVRFHSAHKLLFMAYNQRIMRELGRIVANPGHSAPGEVIAGYGALLPRIFARVASCPAHVNVLMHAFGYFSNSLSAAEKAFFLDALERFRGKKIPLSVPAGIIQSWIVRFGEPYLNDQVYFSPYPESLVEVTDSGKGRSC